MRFLAAMFSEPGGSPSSTRALTAVVCICVVGSWTFVSLTKRELQKMDPELVMLVIGAMGVKVWQRGKENGNGDTKFITKP
jgi:hypothetical protein